METFLAGFMALFPSNPLVISQFPLFIASLSCLTFLVSLAGLSTALRCRKMHLDRIRWIAGRRKDTSERSREGPLPSPRWFFRMLKVVGEVNKPHSDRKLSMVRRTLLKAGYRGADALVIFFGVKFYLALLVPLVYLALRPLAPNALPMTAILFVFLATIGFYAPGIWVKIRMGHRRQKVFEGFPDALDLMVICVEAGLGLDTAIHKVGQEIQLTNRVLSEEFRLLNLGLRAGQSRQLALINLSQRVDVAEVNSFVALLIQTEQFGTSIAQALRVHADAMRLKRRQLAEEKATKLPVKLLFPLLFFIFPSLIVIILGPAILQLMKVLLHFIHSVPSS